MRQETYVFEKSGSNIYKFISRGKKNIGKIVEFTPTGQKMLYNLAFGDVDVNELLNDKSVSNNGDIIKVLATVIDICRDFTSAVTGSIIVFEGSTGHRTRIYNRMMRMYHHFFSIDFEIYASNQQSGYAVFDASTDREYRTFYFKRRNKK